MVRKASHSVKSQMALEYEFTGIRLQDSILTPVDWKLSVNLIALDKKGKSKQDIEHSISIIYQKIYFWLEANMHGILMVDAENEDDMYIANLSSNVMMYCPGNPSDDLIIQLLHAKLTSLSNDDLIISEMHLKGTDTSIQYTYDCIDKNYQLPTKVNEYFSSMAAQDETPWWFRDDGFCFEFIKPDDLDLTDEEKSALYERQDPLDEFYKVIEELSDNSIIGVVKEPAKIVQVEKWKPKKV